MTGSGRAVVIGQLADRAGSRKPNVFVQINVQWIGPFSFILRHGWSLTLHQFLNESPGHVLGYTDVSVY
jgi:hypothetical protein